MVSRAHRGAAPNRTRLSPADALDVAAAFGIDVDGAHAVALTGGYSNEMFLVEAAAGRWTVRRYGRLHVTRRAIAFEHAVVAHAAERMPEIVAPLRRDGGTLMSVPDGGVAAVFPYLVGETGRRDLATAQAAAGVLARFHRAMHDVHVAGGMRSTRLLGILPWLRHRFLRFASDPRIARALDWDALIVAVSAASARVAPRVGALPHVVVHGDPNPENVVSVEAGVVNGLIDFDFAHETERVYDLGTFLDEFARDGDDEPLAIERIAPLLAAYAEHAPITAEERVLIPEAMLRRVATLVWYVATRHGERSPGDIGGAPRYAERVREIVAHAEAIREAARE